MNRWKSAARYVELLEGYVIDTGAGYVAIRKSDGKSVYFAPGMCVLYEVKEWLSNEPTRLTID